ncbi:unnamed protein product [Phytophthora fragariaefolia]|uniref:Unnamed protein product n=1 Tax=Phytophthora fragariaefolia TaxID=1490495 RepID=A0A9W6YBW6_9STRA|nr:unnamed protein product [Phytophthora fragariaefolia]
MEYLTKDSLRVEQDTDRANSKFAVDKAVPEQFRVHPNRYLKSDYDKGHLAPALSYPVLGSPPDTIAVPTHFFKVVLGEKRGGKDFATAGFILPNKAIPENKELSDFLAPLDVIEKHAGLIFFDKVSLHVHHRAFSI